MELFSNESKNYNSEFDIQWIHYKNRERLDIYCFYGTKYLDREEKNV